MTPTSVTAGHTSAVFSDMETTHDESKETLVEYERLVTESLASRIDCTYSEASDLVSQHFDLIEAGFEERSDLEEIAAEIDAQSLVGGGV